MRFVVRMLEAHHRRLAELLEERLPNESVAFLLGTRAAMSDGAAFLVREVLAVPRESYRVQHADIASVAPEVLASVAKRAARDRLVIGMAHIHPMQSGEAGFSLADDAGNQRTYGFFARRAPHTFHVSLVFDRTMRVCAARVYENGDRWFPVEAVAVVDSSVRLELVPVPQRPVAAQYDRQARLLGEEGQRLLGVRRVVVVGGGGAGSLAAVELVHSGVARLDSIDDDTLGDTNRPRIVFASRRDVQLQRPKAEIVEAYIRHVAEDCIVKAHRVPVEDPALRPVLTGADAIVCATDNTTSRAFLNQHGQQNYVPVLDLGVEFVANPRTGRLENERGKANLMRPGTPCMVCTQHIDPERLMAESLPREERARRQGDGYIRGMDEKQPSMMMFNAEVVSVGVQRLLAYFTGFAEYPIDCYDAFAFIGLKRPAGRYLVKKRARDGCPYCHVPGGYLGAGDHADMEIRSRMVT